MSAKHHYVPQFHLRMFSENKKIICLYNKKRNKIILNAAIKNQSYKRNYYIYNNLNIEKDLSTIENSASLLFKNISKLNFKFNDNLKKDLSAYLMLQYSRVPANIEKSIQMKKKMEIITGINEAWSHLHSMTIQLSLLEEIADLSVVILKNNGKCEFVLSDNPVLMINPLLREEHVNKGFGLKDKGLIILFPISPQIVIMLIDSNAYELHSNREIKLSKKDIFIINYLQILNASSNVYFNKIIDNGLIQKYNKSDKNDNSSMDIKIHKVENGEYIQITNVNRVNSERINFCFIKKMKREYLGSLISYSHLIRT
ncbi:MAG: DUF4238 domain-containing protein [bacterium]|nr:DUF4238 domain-containing protein [bacterium]